MPYSNSNRIITIASVSTSPTPQPVTILSPLPPEYRENGGDLQAGDQWYNTQTGNMFVWNGETWRVVNLTPEYIQGNNLDGGSAVPNPQSYKISGGNAAGNGTDGYVIDGGAALINN